MTTCGPINKKSGRTFGVMVSLEITIFSRGERGGYGYGSNNT